MFKVWYRNFVVWQHMLLSSIVANLGEPILYLLSMGYGLGRFVNTVDGVPYLDFIAPALVITSVMNTCSFEMTFSAYTRMAVQRTYEAIAVTPVSLREVILGEILWSTSKGIFAGAIMFLVFFAVGRIHTPMALLVFIVCAVSGFLFSSLAMLCTAYAKGYDFFNYYFTLFISPMFLFSGTFFPLKGLPWWVSIASKFLPLTHAVAASRELFLGRLGLDFFISMLCLLVPAILITGFTVLKMEKRLIS